MNFFQLYFFWSSKNLDPEPDQDSPEMLDPDADSMNSTMHLYHHSPYLYEKLLPFFV
jgi:hypothetical protein